MDKILRNYIIVTKKPYVVPSPSNEAPAPTPPPEAPNILINQTNSATNANYTNFSRTSSKLSRRNKINLKI